LFFRARVAFSKWDLSSATLSFWGAEFWSERKTGRADELPLSAPSLACHPERALRESKDLREAMKTGYWRKSSLFICQL
jgi:hypothetical protein